MLENIFYNEKYYSELSEICEDNDWEKQDVENLKDDYSMEVFIAKQEPLTQLDANFIIERICEERFSENNVENEVDTIKKLLNENMDFEKINNEMPKLWYETRTRVHVTKQMLLEQVNW